jgi:hypothetical protein
VGARFSVPVQIGPGAHPASCTMGTRFFPGVKSGRGVMLSPHPPSSAVVNKEYSYTSTPPLGRTGCTERQCLYKGALYLLFLPVLSSHAVLLRSAFRKEPPRLVDYYLCQIRFPLLSHTKPVLANVRPSGKVFAAIGHLNIVSNTV